MISALFQGARLNEHVLNKYALRTRFFRESRSMRAGYNGGGQVLGHAHNHGGQIQALENEVLSFLAAKSCAWML